MNSTAKLPPGEAVPRLVTVEADTWAEETIDVRGGRSSGERGLGYATLGAYLRELRTRKGLSLRELAAGTGFSNGYLSQVETGAKKTVPSLKVLSALAEFYDIGLDTLLFVSGLQPGAVGMGADASGLDEVDDRFRRLVLHPALKEARIRQDDLRWLAPEVKRMWLRFAETFDRHLQLYPGHTLNDLLADTDPEASARRDELADMREKNPALAEVLDRSVENIRDLARSHAEGRDDQ